MTLVVAIKTTPLMPPETRLARVGSMDQDFAIETTPLTDLSLANETTPLLDRETISAVGDSTDHGVATETTHPLEKLAIIALILSDLGVTLWLTFERTGAKSREGNLGIFFLTLFFLIF